MARGAGAPQGRWTADTEVAFLLALQVHGSVKAACAVVGRSTGATGRRRARLPEFERQCRAALDEHRRLAATRRLRVDDGDPDEGDGDAAGVMDNRVRFDGWTPVRQRAFLRALGRTGCYSKACRVVGLSRTSLDRMRAHYPSFALACERAMGQSAATLEQVAYERAVEGWDEPIVRAGQIIGHRRRYSDALLRLMLQRESQREAARAQTAREEAARPRPRLTTQEVDGLLMQKLDALDRREAKEKRRQMIAWADEMVRRGLAP